ncbi:hypothetical protein N0V93_003688 [Gnomoniopsis smithogilvyi]|uniref:Uncharacterized protein n=1 Tax=Gnomoniopsis smithogilvyi TaxID=1191159 RepID=A0A9W8YX43_9PEZI|nr:hypothetical protein N0V93_003688 [Gnomoniopsis smithogilvyi]
MTPIETTSSRIPPPSSNLPVPPPRDISLDESYQKATLHGYTTAELEDTGAYAPWSIIAPPNLQGALHSILRRQNWSQDALPIPNEYYGARYNLAGLQVPAQAAVEGEYEALDDVIWEAIQPALLLASRVLDSDHPYWNAVLSLYHIKPVPTERDPRKPEQLGPIVGKYSSVWLEQVPDHEMYSSALNLYRMGFQAKDATLAMLNQSVKFVIATGPAGFSGATSYRHPLGTRVFLEAQLIWPLLIPEYTESEKASHYFFLAGVILHELAVISHLIMTVEPDLLVAAGFPVSPEESLQLTALGDEMFGLECAISSEYYFQDQPYGEEGITAEAQYWGGSIDGLPHYGQGIETFPSIKSITCYPPAHPAPWLQNRPNVSFSGPSGYRNWLIRVPVPCMQVGWAIPVDDMAKFLREEWWESALTKYHYHALHILPFAPEGRGVIPGSRNLMSAKMDVGYVSNRNLGQCFQSRVLARFLDDGINHLMTHKQFAIARYLRSLASGKTEAKDIGDRIMYERRTWAPKYQQMTVLLRAVANDLQFLSHDATALMVLPQERWDLSVEINMQAIVQGLENISLGMQTAVRSSLVALEVISRDVLYTSSLVASYHLIHQDSAHRQIIYDTCLESLRTRIVNLRADIVALNQRLSLECSEKHDSSGEQIRNMWLLASARSINDTSRGDTAMSIIQETAADFRRLTAGFTSIIDKLDECQGMLHPSFVHSWDRSWEHSHAVRAANTMRHEHEELRQVAVQEMGRITSPSLIALIDAFCGCIQAYLHDTPVKGVSLDTLGLRRAAAVEAYIEAIARRQIHDLIESSPGDRTEAELEAMLQARIVQIRDDIARDPDVGGNTTKTSDNSSVGKDGVGEGDGDSEMENVATNLHAIDLG